MSAADASSPPPGPARSLRALARACNVSEAAVRKWVAHPAWDLGPRPPWDVAAVQAWRSRLERPAAPGISPARAARAASHNELQRELLREQIRYTRAKADVLARKYVPRQEVEAREVEQAAALRRSLDVLAQRIAAQVADAIDLSGKRREKVEALAAAEVNRLLDQFAGITDDDAPEDDA